MGDMRTNVSTTGVLQLSVPDIILVFAQTRVTVRRIHEISRQLEDSRTTPGCGLQITVMFKMGDLCYERVARGGILFFSTCLFIGRPKYRRHEHFTVTL